MSCLATEPGPEKGFDQLHSQGRSNHTGTEAQDVHVIMFNTLVGRIGVMAKAGTDARNLVGSNTGTYTTAAQQNPCGLS